MNRLLILMVLSLTFTGVTSCKKFLDKKQNNAFVTPQTIEDLQALLDDANETMNIGTTPSFGEASADDIFVPEATLRTLSGPTPFVYRWQAYNFLFPNDWSVAYTPVYNTNYCLEQLLKIEKNEANTRQWNNVYGSALFYRSYYFLMLSWIYSKAYDRTTASQDKGIVIRLSSDFNVRSQRATTEETFQQILTDTKMAITHLPELPQHVFRPSKVAAFALLARTYLSMREYDSAYHYSNLALNIQNSLMDYNGDPEVGNLTATNLFKRFNKETIFYSEMGTGGVYALVAPARSRADTLLYKSYATNDLRRTAYFYLSGGYQRFKGSYAQSTIPFTGLATDEMYLVRAETAARLGTAGLAQANADLNKLMSYRYAKASFVPVQLNDPELLLNHILEERRKELVYRGIRFSDIKRLNKEGRNIVQRRLAGGELFELLPNANYYALPIPEDVIEQTGIEQNEP
ncbi:RagB/SusD family nutrient uptake outer membrane protein [Niabella yanshanensis]|uniref:RagB/SusD family nutrient uptake outer membrane protein n=1 Tax=Niabella yanshanensis TaxID=577386 RepID=A0ABZ0WAM0_9BACT|nr:RagB/SusD family nutrient uptake outer membrane protein [Niabella yanshanensis]WQD39195.1 RagB/SusD family nutrient uptake outer membrane protein [Niabella yanshanensis]